MDCAVNEYYALTKETLSSWRTDPKRRSTILLKSVTFMGLGAGAVVAMSLGLFVTYWVVTWFVSGVRDAVRGNRED